MQIILEAHNLHQSLAINYQAIVLMGSEEIEELSGKSELI